MAVAYAHISRNRRRSAWFIILFALSTLAFTYLATFGFFVLVGVLAYFRPTNVFTWGSVMMHAWMQTQQACCWLLPLCFGLSVFWAHLALKEGAELILGRLSGVRLLLKWDAHDTYVLLENLCIRTGDVVPRLYLLEDNSLNAFSIGTHPKNCAIVVSKGLLEKLDRVQLEAVLAHELAHIRNQDTRTMTVLVTCLAFFTFVGEYFFYIHEKEDIYEENNLSLYQIRQPFGPLAYIGLVLLMYGYVIAPLLRLGLSRTREQLADADAALMTRHPRALAKALWRISMDSRIEALDRTALLGALCIETPAKKPTWFGWFSGLYRSHPPVEDRIRALNDMDGMFSPRKSGIRRKKHLSKSSSKTTM